MSISLHHRHNASAAFPASQAAGKVIDADYVVVDPPSARAGVSASSRSSGETAGGIGILRPSRAARDAPMSRRAGAGFWSVGFTLAMLSFWVSGGHALAAAWMEAGRDRAPAGGGLTLALLGSNVTSGASGPVLEVETEITNERAQARPTPAVAILIVANNGDAMRYAAPPVPGEIGAGGRQRLTSRMPAPAGGVRSVSVAFAS